MGVNEIKQNIIANEANRENTLKELQMLKEAIVAEIKPYANMKLKDIVEGAVRNNPDHTKELGKEALSEMKKRLSDLLAVSDNIVDKIFDNDELWLHIGYTILPDGSSTGQRYNNLQKSTENISTAIKYVFGEAGRILIDYKFAEASDWKPRYATNWFIMPNKEVMYGHGTLSLSESLKKLIKNYGEALGNLHDSLEDEARLKEKLSEQEAVDLWAEV